jgi:hypothetical protein
MHSLLTKTVVAALLFIEACECSLQYSTNHIFNGLEKLRKRQDGRSFQENVSRNRLYYLVQYLPVLSITCRHLS